MKRGLCRAAAVLALAVGSLVAVQSSAAASGDLLSDHIAATDGFGHSVQGGRGVAFDGTTLYYTFEFLPYIYEMSAATGAFLSSIPAGGTTAGPLAWDGTALWTTNYTIGNQFLYRVDPATGAALSSCNYVTQNPGNIAASDPLGLTFAPDGLDWTGSSLWMSSDANPGNYAAELDTSCTILRYFQPPVATGALSSCGTSGLAVVGNILWHGYPCVPALRPTDLAGNALPGGFATPGHFDEDLALDQVTFAPRCALWANETGAGTDPGESHLRAYEIPCPVTYTVTFLQPLDQTTDPGQPVKNAGRNGRVIPVRVQIHASDGSDVTNATNPTVTMTVSHLTSCTSSTSDAIETYAPAGSANNDGLFRWDGAAWAYNWDTSTSGLVTGDCYRININLNGSEIPTAFAIYQPVR